MLLYIDSMGRFSSGVISTGAKYEQWEDDFGVITSGANYGRNGRGIRLQTNSNFLGNDGYIYKFLPGDYQTLYTGIAFRASLTTDGGYATSDGYVKGSSRQIIAFTDDQHAQISLLLSPSMRIVLKRGETGSTLARSTHRLREGIFHYIEFGAKFDGSAGWFIVRVDGEEWTELSLTGQNTINTSNAFANGVKLGNNVQFSGSFSGSFYEFSEWYITSEVPGTEYNGFLGDVYIGGQLPNANVSSSSWEPTSGTTHYTIINDTEQTTSFAGIRTSTPDALETFSLTSPSPTSGTTLAVAVNIYAKKDNAGVVRMSPVVSNGTTTFAGTQMYLNQSPTYHTQLFTRNPVDNSQWPISLSGLSFGVKKI